MRARGILSWIAVWLSFGLPFSAWGQEDESLFGLYMSGKERLIPLPLAETRVRGIVSGFVARVKVTQVYVNPYDAVIEATYVFPLPERAAVTSMIMHLSDRDVVAEIKEKKEAEEIYKEAVEAGHTAALMTQQRPNIFTQKVGNIPAGDKIEVEIEYVDVLGYTEGVSAFVFPTVVGPRYIPGQPLPRPDLERRAGARCADTDRVLDAGAISPPVLRSNETSAHRIDLELEVAPGLPIASLTSPSHDLAIDRRGDDRAMVRIAKGDRIPNKDFILRIDLRAKRPAVTVLAHKNGGGNGYLTLSVQPPAFPKSTEIAPKDLFFVVDNSGSMHGKPIEACKELMRVALRGMNPDDRFSIMRFSNHVSALSRSPLENTPGNVERGIGFIDEMSGMGGTEMLSGIRRAIEGSVDAGRVRIVFFLTDGYIGNEQEILKAISEENEAQARLFSLGVGSSVNRYLLTGMARIGRGQAQIMRYDEDPGPFVERFYRMVRNPVLTDVQLSWGDLDVFDQTPGVIPDLFDNRPLLVHARYGRAQSGTVTMGGRVGNQTFSYEIPVDLPDRNQRPEIASLWARARIGEWMDEDTRFPEKRKEEITELALDHSLMSKYTAFVAVDREVINRKPKEPLIPVSQRLPLPDGVTARALGCLSRQLIPPGDPILSVGAPEDAARVTAYFPFGLVLDLAYDQKREVWRGRFLVPAGIPDGIYTVLIVVEMEDGQVVYDRISYVLDSRAEEFVVEFSKEVLGVGAGVDVFVDAVEPAFEVYVHCPELGWERIQLEAEDDGRIDWTAELEVPEDAITGRFEVMVVVRDAAGNRLEQTVTIHVQRESL
jgi:Ca-activated chloride channel family protein